MKVLLDTAPLLWLASTPERLSETALQIVLDEGNELFLSAVSAWEITIKSSSGKLTLPDRPERFVVELRDFYAIASLPLDEESSFQLSRLPNVHRDPFDRMLAAQSVLDELPLITRDAAFPQFGVQAIW